jgi:hypothetical protein
MGIMMGGRYRLVRHPSQPIGVAKHSNGNREILVEWENKQLIPPSDYYSEDMFSDGSFEYLGWASDSYLGDYDHSQQCGHEWATYTGITRVFEYCTKCDIKRDI